MNEKCPKCGASPNEMQTMQRGVYVPYDQWNALQRKIAGLNQARAMLRHVGDDFFTAFGKRHTGIEKCLEETE